MGPKRATKKSKFSPRKNLKNVKNLLETSSIRHEEPAVKKPKYITSEMADQVGGGFDWREFIQLPSEEEVKMGFDAAAWAKTRTTMTMQSSGSPYLDVESVKKIAEDHGVLLTDHQSQLFLPEIEKIAQALDGKHGSDESKCVIDAWKSQNMSDASDLQELEISKTEVEQEGGGFIVVTGKWNEYPQVEIPNECISSMENDRRLTLYKCTLKVVPKAPEVSSVPPAVPNRLPESLRVHTLAMIRLCLQDSENVRLTEVFKHDTTIPNSLDFVLRTVSTHLNEQLQRGIGNAVDEAATCLRIFENVLANDNLDQIYVQSRLHLMLPATITSVVRRPEWPKLGHMKTSWLEFREKTVALLHTIVIKYQGTEFGHNLQLRMLKAFSWGLIASLDYLEPAYGCLKGLWTLMDGPMYPVFAQTLMKLENNIRSKQREDPLSAAKLRTLIHEIKSSPNSGYARTASSYASTTSPS